MTTLTNNHRASDQDHLNRRRPDWQSNDRRQAWPWVVDSNDRRTGQDRRIPDAPPHRDSRRSH